MSRRRIAAARDDGAVTLWAFLLMLVLLGFIGLAVDFWHLWEARRDLHAVADSSATAGAGAVDETRFRLQDVVALDPDEAGSYANEAIDAQTDLPALSQRLVLPNTERVYVRLESDVDLTLMRIFAGSQTVTITAEATAFPYRSDPL